MPPGANFELRYYVAIQVKPVSQQVRPMQVFPKLQSLGTAEAEGVLLSILDMVLREWDLGKCTSVVKIMNEFLYGRNVQQNRDIIGMEESLYCWYSRRILGICMSEVLKTGMEL